MAAVTWPEPALVAASPPHARTVAVWRRTGNARNRVPKAGCTIPSARGWSCTRHLQHSHQAAVGAMTIELNTGVPHSARVYDFWLGGKDNFEADRALANTIQETVPTVPMMVRANRDFIHRAVRYLAGEAGIRQFLDIGTGIPTRPNLHEVVQDLAPESRVVYVDNDPIVLVHARALLVSSPQGRCDYLDADLRDPTAILNSKQLRDTLDLTQPVAVTFGSILMLLADEEDPWAIVRHLMDALPAGSYLVVSHPAGDMNPDAMAHVSAASANAGLTFVPRSKEDVARFFGDNEMAEPGLVPVLAWHPDKPPTDPDAAYYWVGVSRK